MSSSPTGNPTLGLIIQIAPFVVLNIPFVIAAAIVAIYKGKNPFLHFFLACIPFANFGVLVWLLSLTGKNVLERLERLEREAESRT